MPKLNIVMGWLRIINTIGSWMISVVLSVLFVWHGCSELYRWYTTGELLVRVNRPYVRWVPITYESYPFKFVESFATLVLMAAVGLAMCAWQCCMIRKWWINKPKPTTE